MKANPPSEPGRDAVADPAVPAEPIGDALSTPAASPTDLLPPGSARRQLLAAYTAAGAKVIAWVVAAAVVYRMMGPGPFALFMLLRGTVALLNNTTFGLGPAVLHFTTKANQPLAPVAVEILEAPEPGASSQAPVLAYAARGVSRRFVVEPGETPASVLLHAFWLVLGLATCGTVLIFWYVGQFTSLHTIPRNVLPGDLAAVGLLAFGTLLRAVGDVAGGFNQARGRFTLDAWLSAGADLFWAMACIKVAWDGPMPMLDEVANAYLLTGLLAAVARWSLAVALRPDITAHGVRPRYRVAYWFHGRLLSFGGLVTLGSVADWLYAPIDYVILNRLVDPLAVAVYAPAVQIDAALILLVNAIAAVILPRAAIRHAADDRAGVWREYVRGVLGAAGITLAGALLAWWVSGRLFELWLGDEMVGTQAILPLVLLHTVLGSGGGVGRSTMLAMGRAGTYAASVLAGGLLNIILSVAFVYAGLGLSGVILGTVISVALRCVLWMPWYIRRALRRRRE